MSWIREPNAEPIPGYAYRAARERRVRRSLEVRSAGRPVQGHQVRLRQPHSVDVDGVRAEQEFKALQRIKEVRHPFVCSLDRIDFVDGELIIVMELADQTPARPLQEYQSAGLIGIPPTSCCATCATPPKALDFMNEKHNLQHLDVKPRNLFLVGDRVKVADFGLVKTLERQSSGVLGSVTPMYASPETFVGKLRRTAINTASRSCTRRC